MVQIILILSLFLCSCGKPKNDKEEIQPGNSKLRIIEKFNFKLTKPYSLKGVWTLRDGQPAPHVRLDIYSENGKSFFKSIVTNSKGQYSTKILTATNEGQVLIKCKDKNAVKSKKVSMWLSN